MTKPISLRDYTLPETVGATVRTNHIGCPAGTDTRNRLYITRQKPFLYLGYCHNCGNAGVLRNVNGVLRHARRLDGALIPNHGDTTPETPPMDLVNIVHAPASVGLTRAISWLRENQVEVESILAERHLFWSDKMQRLIVRDSDGYWTARDCTGESALKWYTPANRKKPAFPSGVFHRDTARCSSTVVITEDPISALRVTQQYASVRAYPLYGTHLSDGAAAALANDPLVRHVIVWLDSDAAGVAGADKVRNKISLVADLKVRNPTGTYEEPKKCSNATIRNVMEAYGR